MGLERVRKDGEALAMVLSHLVACLTEEAAFLHVTVHLIDIPSHHDMILQAIDEKMATNPGKAVLGDLKMVREMVVEQKAAAEKRAAGKADQVTDADKLATLPALVEHLDETLQGTCSVDVGARNGVEKAIVFINSIKSAKIPADIQQALNSL